LKKLLTVFAFVCLGLGAHAQNLTTVNGSNITDINGTKLAAGQLCFLITDTRTTRFPVSIGGGGTGAQARLLFHGDGGLVTSFTVPIRPTRRPRYLLPRDGQRLFHGQEVLRYALVSFTGATFNFDNYAPRTWRPLRLSPGPS